jgi:hypothetical protein
MFNSVEDVKNYMSYKCNIDISEMKPNSEIRIKKWYQNDNEEAQFGFECKKKDGDIIRFVATKFRDGIDCWIIGDNGVAIRI